MKHCYLGIDPGASGGLALLTPNRIFLSEMPESEESLWQWLKNVIENNQYAYGLGTRAVVEMVTGYVAERGEKGEPGSRMFQFGVSYGGIRMALTALGLIDGLTYHSIHPRTWQKVYGLRREANEKGSKGKTRWKGRLKIYAQSLFPSEKLTLKTCDALLIAEYCRRLYGDK